MIASRAESNSKGIDPDSIGSNEGLGKFLVVRKSLTILTEVLIIDASSIIWAELVMIDIPRSRLITPENWLLTCLLANL